ncbi:NADPh quinone reductase [Linnemannia gamsii]|uniref:NADPh quinone reductase n=1 Tax=Linnemannia gamsii TaxID=64522 RepID=A0A9P6UTY5_9FUNG|nr:NADPh quinone reductase [Linnemannia gamsii]
MSDNTSHLPQTIKSVQWTTPSLSPKEALTFNESAPLLPTASLTGSNVLVKVHAAALNPVDWKLMRGGVPRLLMPKIKVPGLDISGTIVAVGPKANKRGFKVGDEVVAMLHFSQSGALTEYTVVGEAYLARKPERWTHEQAAAWPLVATTVWQAVVVRGNVKKGDKVLINGASGGTGTVGVQIAKALGAYVVGVCSTDNVELVKKLGADEVVDYKKENVTEKYTNQDFDLIFDTVGSAAEIWAKSATILKPSGNLVRISGPDNTMDTPFTFLAAGAEIGYHKISSFLKRGPGYHLFTAFPDGEVLAKAINLLDEAQADPVIDSVNEFTLPAVLAAFDKSQSHRAKGKIVIKIA